MRMPRYFFNITSNGAQSLDDEGVELRDASEARREAIKCASALFSDDETTLAIGGIAMTMRATDEFGASICTVRLTVEG